MAPIYYAYGDVLLRHVETSDDALGGPAEDGEGFGGAEESAAAAGPAAAGASSSSAAAAPRSGGVSESKGDDDEEEEEEEDEGDGEGEGGAASAGAAAAAPAEEDITNVENDAEGGQDDLEIAWECLDVARVIYSRVEGTEAKLALARAQLRLGDCHMESDRFDMALDEYQSCLTTRSALLPKDDT